jgi:hypothetical protein
MGQPSATSATSHDHSQACTAPPAAREEAAEAAAEDMGGSANPLELLPNELWSLILDSTPPRQLPKLRLVCRRLELVVSQRLEAFTLKLVAQQPEASHRVLRPAAPLADASSAGLPGSSFSWEPCIRDLDVRLVDAPSAPPASPQPAAAATGQPQLDTAPDPQPDAHDPAAPAPAAAAPEAAGADAATATAAAAAAAAAGPAAAAHAMADAQGSGTEQPAAHGEPADAAAPSARLAPHACWSEQLDRVRCNLVPRLPKLSVLSLGVIPPECGRAAGALAAAATSITRLRFARAISPLEVAAAAAPPPPPPAPPPPPGNGGGDGGGGGLHFGGGGGGGGGGNEGGGAGGGGGGGGWNWGGANGEGEEGGGGEGAPLPGLLHLGLLAPHELHLQVGSKH